MNTGNMTLEEMVGILEENGYKIIKPIKKPKDEYTFDKAWNLYQKKVGNKKDLERRWNRLSKEERKAAIEYIPMYVIATPEKQYRKNFQTFINQRSWNDELITECPNDVANQSIIANLIEKSKEPPVTNDVRMESLRQRLLSMIGYLEENPNSLCRGQLECYYKNGTLLKLGITWKP